MDRNKLLEVHKTTCEAARLLMEKKNQDYATNLSVFENLDMCEAVGLTSTEKGILIRIQDKLTRLRILLDKPPHVKDESFDDSARDVINYVVLLIAKRSTREASKTPD